MLLLTIIFLVLSLLAVFDFINTKYKNILFFCLGIFLIIVSAFRPSTLDRDYDAYLRMFDADFIFGQSLVEPSFIFISYFIHQYLFAKSIFLFLIYASIAVTTKLIAIKQLSDFKFISLLLYFSYSFILHDMTQIRAGVSVGFVLLCVKPLYNRQVVKFLIFTFLAVLFHYSALLVLLLWFLQPDKINVKLYIAMIFISYLIFFFSNVILTNIINYLPHGVLLNKIASYKSDNGEVLNVFNSWQIMRCIICFVFLWKIKAIKEKNKYAVLFLKIYVLATVSFVLLASNPTFAGRVSDLFSIIDIVMLPCLVYIITPKMAGVLLMIIIGFLYLVLNLFYNKIIF